jgi:hypothetical protein
LRGALREALKDGAVIVVPALRGVRGRAELKAPRDCKYRHETTVNNSDINNFILMGENG